MKFSLWEKVLDKTFDKEFNKLRQATLYDYKRLIKDRERLFSADTIFDYKGTEKGKSFLKYFLIQINN